MWASPFNRMSPSQHRGIGTETAFPEHMAQQHDTIVAGLVLARKKRAAQRRLHAEDVEVVRRDARASDRDRLAPTGQRGAPANFRGDVLEDGILVRPIEIVQGGDAIEPAGGKPFEDAHDAVRFGIGQRTE